MLNISNPALMVTPWGITRISNAKHWSYAFAEGFTKTFVDEAYFLDVQGGLFIVDKIELHNPSVLRSIMKLSEHFFVPFKADYTIARAEVSFSFVRSLNLEEAVVFLKKASQVGVIRNHREIGDLVQKEIDAVVSNSNDIDRLVMNFPNVEFIEPREDKAISSRVVDLRTRFKPW